jgi:nucleoid DNA-binding protein
MKLRELIQKISEEKTEVLGKVPQGKALAIVKEVLAEIKREIEARKEGKISVPGMGTFIISNKEKEGKKIKKIRDFSLKLCKTL